jgi:hypothetical protein
MRQDKFAGRQTPCSLATDLARKDRAETVLAFVKQILNIAEREWKPNI